MRKQILKEIGFWTLFVIVIAVILFMALVPMPKEPINIMFRFTGCLSLGYLGAFSLCSLYDKIYKQK